LLGILPLFCTTRVAQLLATGQPARSGTALRRELCAAPTVRRRKQVLSLIPPDTLVLSIYPNLHLATLAASAGGAIVHCGPMYAVR
jgi:hypothetical protein